MWNLSNGYSIKQMDRETFQPLYQKYSKEFFDDKQQVLHLRELYDETEKEKMNELDKLLGTPYVLRLGVFKGEEFVGWHFGFQQTASEFYMCNSAILPAHRKMGLYTELLKQTLSILSEKGFQKIYSRHMPNNNAVIIPKLKAGFVISSMQLDDMFGVLVHLTYYTNKLRLKAFDYRTGNSRMSDELSKFLR